MAHLGKNRGREQGQTTNYMADLDRRPVLSGGQPVERLTYLNVAPSTSAHRLRTGERAHAMLDDAEYYYKRAEAELKMAQRSEVPEAVRAHYLIANYYLDHVYSHEVGEHSELGQLLCRTTAIPPVST